MATLLAASNTSRGVAFALGGAVVFSLNDMAIKALSGAYPLHQVILLRGMIGMTCILFVMRASAGGLAQMRTTKPWRHLLRMTLVLISNAAYFMGLAALPLADAVAIAFVAPVIITLMSMVFLGEKVGPHRLFAVALGLLGTVILMRPGHDSLQMAGVLVLISAVSYSAGQLLARSMRETESAPTLAFYVQVSFLVASSLVGLMLGDGAFSGSSDPAIAFLTRAWVWPQPQHLIFFVMSGFAVAAGGIMMAQAYRTLEAAVVAPFEYAAIPMAILWGVTFFGTWPDTTGFIGMGLILTAGLYTMWREHLRKASHP